MFEILMEEVQSRNERPKPAGALNNSTPALPVKHAALDLEPDLAGNPPGLSREHAYQLSTAELAPALKHDGASTSHRMQESVAMTTVSHNDVQVTATPLTKHNIRNVSPDRLDEGLLFRKDSNLEQPNGRRPWILSESRGSRKHGSTGAVPLSSVRQPATDNDCIHPEQRGLLRKEGQPGREKLSAVMTAKNLTGAYPINPDRRRILLGYFGHNHSMAKDSPSRSNELKGPGIRNMSTDVSTETTVEDRVTQSIMDFTFGSGAQPAIWMINSNNGHGVNNHESITPLMTPEMTPDFERSTDHSQSAALSQVHGVADIPIILDHREDDEVRMQILPQQVRLVHPLIQLANKLGYENLPLTSAMILTSVRSDQTRDGHNPLVSVAIDQPDSIIPLTSIHGSLSIEIDESLNSSPDTEMLPLNGSEAAVPARPEHQLNVSVLSEDSDGDSASPKTISTTNTMRRDKSIEVTVPDVDLHTDHLGADGTKHLTRSSGQDSVGVLGVRITSKHSPSANSADSDYSIKALNETLRQQTRRHKSKEAKKIVQVYSDMRKDAFDSFFESGPSARNDDLRVSNENKKEKELKRRKPLSPKEGNGVSVLTHSAIVDDAILNKTNESSISSYNDGEFSDNINDDEEVTRKPSSKKGTAPKTGLKSPVTYVGTRSSMRIAVAASKANENDQEERPLSTRENEGRKRKNTPSGKWLKPIYSLISDHASVNANWAERGKIQNLVDERTDIANQMRDKLGELRSLMQMRPAAAESQRFFEMLQQLSDEINWFSRRRTELDTQIEHLTHGRGKRDLEQ